MDQNINEKIGQLLKWYTDVYGKLIYVSQMNLPTGASRSKIEAKEELSPLQQFKKQIENCPNCPLHKSRTNFVFGVGNEKADIMFVGEAPGKYEDLQGEPFVGRAGKLLTQMLSHIHLKRSDVYIANILKCRPPNNRDPLPEEVEECIPYLHRQIELIKPKIIVALGRIAAQNLLNTKDSLSKLKSTVWSYRGVPLIITYHPAAILRNQGLLDIALQDFRGIAKYYQSL